MNRRRDRDEMRALCAELVAQRQLTEAGAARILEVWDAENTGSLRHPGRDAKEKAWRMWAGQQGGVPGPPGGTY